MPIQHETIFKPATNGFGMKVVWQEEYNAATMKTRVTVLSVWAWAYTAYAGSWYPHGKITLRDANSQDEATVVVESGLDNRFTGLGTAWVEIPNLTLGYIDISHRMDGTAALEIGVEPSVYRNNWSYNKYGDAGNWKDVVPATNPAAFPGIEVHQQGLVRIDTGTEFQLAVPYIDNGSEWVQAIPYIDSGSAWTACG